MFGKVGSEICGLGALSAEYCTTAYTTRWALESCTGFDATACRFVPHSMPSTKISQLELAARMALPAHKRLKFEYGHGIILCGRASFLPARVAARSQSVLAPLPQVADLRGCCQRSAPTTAYPTYLLASMTQSEMNCASV